MTTMVRKPGFGYRSRACKLRPVQAILLALLGVGVVQMVFRVHLPQRALFPRTNGSDDAGQERATVETHSRSTTSSAPTLRKELLLASHGRLMWFDTDSGDVRVVHEGRGAYYGVIPASVTEQRNDTPPRVWVVSRPHNWRPKTTKEALLLIDTADGTLIEELATKTSFTHDVVRHGDEVFLADTGAGAIGRINLASRTANSTVLFTFKDHINTVAVVPTAAGKPMLWAILHGLGQSALVCVDPDTMQVTRRFRRVGTKSHGFSLWRGKVVMLSSEEGTVILVDLTKAEAEGDAYQPEKLWVEPSRTFMKGLTVIGDVAYFGISAFGTRSERDSPTKTSEARLRLAAPETVGAFDLARRKFLWRKTVPSNGLLNIVAAPQLGQSSTSLALPGWTPDASAEAWKAAMAQPLLEKGAGGLQARLVTGEGSGGVQSQPLGKDRKRQHHMLRKKDEVPISDTPVPWVPWDGKGTAPRIELRWKARVAAKRGDFELEGGEDARGPRAFQALRHVDVSAVAAAVRGNATIWDAETQRITNAVLAGREGNAAHFKPGCSTAQLVFSDQNANECFVMPWWHDWKHLVGPLIAEVLSWYGIPRSEFDSHLMRVQFARMGPGGSILKHVDMGGWAIKLHRIHVPLVTNPDVEFLMQNPQGDFAQVHVAPGDVFEINNAISHLVRNGEEEERVHLLLDVSEEPVTCKQMQRGQECKYHNAHGVVC